MQPWAHWALVLEQGSRELARLLSYRLAPGARTGWAGAAPEGLEPGIWQRSCSNLTRVLSEVARALEATAGAAEPLSRLFAHTQTLRGVWCALLSVGAAASAEGTRWIDSGVAEGDWHVHASPGDLAALF